MVLLSTDLHMEVGLHTESGHKVKTMLIRWNKMDCDRHRDQRQMQTCHAPLPFLYRTNLLTGKPTDPCKQRGEPEEPGWFLVGGCKRYLEKQRDEGESKNSGLHWQCFVKTDVCSTELGHCDVIWCRLESIRLKQKRSKRKTK